MSILTDRNVSANRVRAIVLTPMSDTLRNHLVTLCYLDMGVAMAKLLGEDDANWTTLAVWPSFTVGATIRASDDPTGLKRMLHLAKSDPVGLARNQATRRVLRGRTQEGGMVLNRSLAAGNRGVFYEIGLCWADFLATFANGPLSDDDTTTEFAKFQVRVDNIGTAPGKLWPDTGRENLKKAFAAYIAAKDADTPKARAELILLGNIWIGLHEQARLQGWLDLSMLNPVRIMSKPVSRFVDDKFLGTFENRWSHALTRHVFTVTMGEETVRVGRPVPALQGDQLYPAPLDTLEDPIVKAAFDDAIAQGPGATTGAEHWNDYGDRMSFIASLFRARQRAGLVGMSPYTEEEEAQIWAAAAAVDVIEASYTTEGPLLFPPTDVSPWSADVVQAFAARLDAAKNQCDPLVDDAVEKFYSASGIQKTDRHFTDVMMEVASPGGPTSPAIRDYLDGAPQLPPWTDLERVHRAQQFFETFRPTVHACNFFGAMFQGYAAANGVQVLALVSDLTKSPERRLWESTRFFEDVGTTPFWETGSAGWKSIRGVRLYHASMRSTIESGSQHIVSVATYETDRLWDPSWGRPIHQEHMFGYILTMSVLLIENMDKIGSAMTDEQARDWVHFWNVIGALMGVDLDLLQSPLDPSRDLSFEEARFANSIILSRNLGPSDQGRQLTMSLLEQMGWFPGPVRRVARSFVRSSIGDRAADMIGIPPRGWLEPALAGGQNLARSLRQSGAYAATSKQMTEWLGHQFLHWWEQQYKDTPPYRQGGVAAVQERAPDPSTRLPRQISVSIESVGPVPDDVTDAIAAVNDVHLEAQTPPPGNDDDFYESLGLQTLLQGTATAGPAVAALITTLRSSARRSPNITQVNLVIDGRQVPLSRLTDAEIEQLLPEVSA
jgi:hypothetical protein